MVRFVWCACLCPSKTVQGHPTEVDKRLQLLPLLANQLFGHGQLITALCEASAEKENLGSLKDARKLEMEYTFAQKINPIGFRPEKASMTLKMMLLFSFDLKLEAPKLKEYCEEALAHAVVGGAGTLVYDLFKDDGLRSKATDWMRDAAVDVAVETGGTIYMSPTFEESQDDGGSDVMSHEGRFASDSEVMSDQTQVSDDVSRVGGHVAREDALLLRLKGCETNPGNGSVKDSVHEVVKSVNSERRSPRLNANARPTDAVDAGLEYVDMEDVVTVAGIFGNRTEGASYNRNLKTKYSVPVPVDEHDDTDGDGDSGDDRDDDDTDEDGDGAQVITSA